MKTTVRDLLDQLDGLPEDAEVRIAEQPSEDLPIVYLVEGDQLAYLPGDASDRIGWAR